MKKQRHGGCYGTPSLEVRHPHKIQHSLDFRKYRFLLVLLWLPCAIAIGQNKPEREHRILKSQFPTEAYSYVVEKVPSAKKMRFYREVAEDSVTYILKFKKDRLFYHLDFDRFGNASGAGFSISGIDVPNSSWSAIQQNLATEFDSYKIKGLWQEYPKTAGESWEQTLKQAFQNLLTPNLRYTALVRGKNKNGKELYHVVFDAEGNRLDLRPALPANYDHVLY